MRSMLSVMISLSLVLMLDCGGSSTTGTKKLEECEFGKLYSSAELRSDLEFILNAVRNVHPDSSASIEKRLFQLEAEKTAKALDRPMSRISYFRTVAPLLSLLKDGHTSVTLPEEEWEQFRRNGGKAFPFFVTCKHASGIRVETNLDTNNSIPVGTRIVQINNLSADSLFEGFKRYVGSERREYNEFITAHYFRRYLWLHGIVSPFVLKVWVSDTNEEKSVFSEGAGPQTQIAERKPYEYRRLYENIGYIVYNEMRDDRSEPFDEFLERVFRDLRVSKAKGLIVDLRDNGGGSTDHVKELLQYVADKPYRSCSMSYRKVSKEYKLQMRGSMSPVLRWVTYPPVVWLGALCSDELKVFTAKEGDLIEHDFDETHTDGNALRFTGKVCFLPGTAPFSSAVDLVDAVKTYKLATIIGEETGGIPTSFGDRVQFRLPNTRLEFSVASARFVRANGDQNDKEGILPDIEAEESIEDLHNNRDTVLEQAREWIRH